MLFALYHRSVYLIDRFLLINFHEVRMPVIHSIDLFQFSVTSV